MRQIILKFSRHPLLSCIFIIVISILSFSQLSKLKINVSATGMMIENDPSMAFYNKTKEIFGSENITIIYVKDKKLFTPEKLEILSDIIGEFEDLEYVSKVESLFNTKNFKGEGGILSTEPFFEEIPEEKDEIERIKKDAINNPLVYQNLISKNGDAIAINLYVDVPHDEPDFDKKFSKQIERIITKLKKDFEQVFQFGNPYIRKVLGESIIKDQQTITPLAILVLLLALVIGVRTINGAIIPILTSSISILWTLGFMGFFGYPLNVLTAIVPALIIVIGSTEDMHIISEFYEGLHLHKDRYKAIEYMATKIGLAIFLTFLTTFTGFFSIYFNNIKMLKEFGIVSSFGLLANFIITIILTPIYLSFFGKKKREGTNSHHISGFFHLIAEFFINIIKIHRKKISVLAFILSVVMIIGTTHIIVNNNLMGYFKEGSDVKVRNKIITDDFCGLQSFYIVVETGIKGAFKKAAYLKKLQEIQDYLKSTGHFDASFSIADYIKLINEQMHSGKEKYFCIPESDELIAQYYLFFSRDDISKYVNNDYSKACILVRHHIEGSFLLNKYIRALKEYMNKISGISTRITGENILINKAADTMAEGQALSLFLLILVIFGIMSILFVNIKAGFLSLIPNLFPILILFGIMGYGKIYLDTGTAMIAAIAIGIAMDDTIHCMVRYYKEMKYTKDQVKAMENTIKSEIVPVLSTSVAVSLGFGILVFSSFKPVVNFGLLTAATMLFAFLTDMIITPLILVSSRLITLWDLLSVDVQEILLYKSPLFKGMRRWEIRKIILLGDVVEYRQGERIIRQGDIGKEMFVILKGEAAVEKISSDGTTLRITRFAEGDIFGEIGLISNIKRTADVVALTDTTVLKLEWRSLERIGRYLPMISSKLFLNIARILGERLAPSHEKV